MSQRRPNVLAFKRSPGSRLELPATKLDSVRCEMLPAKYNGSRPFVAKAERLLAMAPDLAAIVEELLDELLSEVS